MDVYDPVSNTISPTDKQRIAAWFSRHRLRRPAPFCICQAFFPDKSKWSKLAKALGGKGIVAEGAFDALSGLRSLPFPRPSSVGAAQAVAGRGQGNRPARQRRVAGSDHERRIRMITRIVIENFKSLRKADLCAGTGELVNWRQRQWQIELPRRAARSSGDRQRLHHQRDSKRQAEGARPAKSGTVFAGEALMRALPDATRLANITIKAHGRLEEKPRTEVGVRDHVLTSGWAGYA